MLALRWIFLWILSLIKSIALRDLLLWGKEVMPTGYTSQNSGSFACVGGLFCFLNECVASSLWKLWEPLFYLTEQLAFNKKMVAVPWAPAVLCSDLRGGYLLISQSKGTRSLVLTRFWSLPCLGVNVFLCNFIISQNFCRQRSSSVFLKQVGLSVLCRDVSFDSCRVLYRTAVSLSSVSSLPLHFPHQIT